MRRCDFRFNVIQYLNLLSDIDCSNAKAVAVEDAYKNFMEKQKVITRDALYLGMRDCDIEFVSNNLYIVKYFVIRICRKFRTRSLKKALILNKRLEEANNIYPKFSLWKYSERKEQAIINIAMKRKIINLSNETIRILTNDSEYMRKHSRNDINKILFLWRYEIKRKISALMNTENKLAINELRACFD